VNFNPKKELGDYTMKKETRMISLSVLSILTLCLLNVTAASPSNHATATNVKATIPTTLTFNCPTQAKVNKSIDYSLSLTSGGTGVSGAIIHTQYLEANGQWTTLGTHTTDSNGNFAGIFIMYATGVYTYRVTYDGDSQYASSVSNEVVVTAS